jgi:hypothetical protein
MPISFRGFLLMLGLCAWVIARLGVAQQPAAPVVTRTGGVDAPSGIAWVHLAIEGRLVATGSAQGSTPELPPMLTAQCTQTRDGNQRFELLADAGGVKDKAYYPPWRPRDQNDHFPPRLDKVKVTMEFLGYTHVKPVKREWVELLEPAGELKYSTPSFGSANMEEITFYLRYLLALPTLRLSAQGLPAVEFVTTPLLNAIRAEPMCSVAGM